MTGRELPVPAIQFRPRVAQNPAQVAMAAQIGDRDLAELLMVRHPAALRVAVDTSAAPVADGGELVALVDAIIGLARADSFPAVVLVATVLATRSNLRLRHYARIAGFAGPLRAELSLDLRPPSPPLTPRPPAPADRLVADLHLLLPGVQIVAALPAGRVRSFLRGASSGVEGTVHLTAHGPADPGPLALALPVEDDVMAEGVALAIDTALSVRRRFRPLVDRVRVFYDHAVHGLRSGLYAGVAEPSVRDVHLNPAYARASEMETLERQIEERALEPSGPPRRPPLLVLPPFTRVDSVVAHEFWHQIEFGFESGRYRDSVAFRRAVGAYFGVETLEHAIKGNRADAPPEWQRAHAMLAEEVSAYAATAPKEATAELFTQWWCTAADPPPSARHFGAILHQFFPAADLVR